MSWQKNKKIASFQKKNCEDPKKKEKAKKK